MADDLNPSQQAAAFHGLATNRTIDLPERLALALQACKRYEAEVERLRALLERANDAQCGCLGGIIDGGL